MGTHAFCILRSAAGFLRGLDEWTRVEAPVCKCFWDIFRTDELHKRILKQFRILHLFLMKMMKICLSDSYPAFWICKEWIAFLLWIKCGSRITDTQYFGGHHLYTQFFICLTVYLSVCMSIPTFQNLTVLLVKPRVPRYKWGLLFWPLS